MARQVQGIEWDSGNWPKCGRHGVSQADVEMLLAGDPMILPDRTERTDETRFNAVGKSEDGRALFVVFTIRRHDGGDFIRPISARFMHAKEVKHYER